MTSSLTAIIIISCNLIHDHILADVCRPLLLPDKVIFALLLMTRSRHSQLLSAIIRYWENIHIHVTMQKEVTMLGYIDFHTKEHVNLCQK